MSHQKCTRSTTCRAKIEQVTKDENAPLSDVVDHAAVAHLKWRGIKEPRT